jgi:hypothetical protein
MARVNPCGVDGDVPLVSVGFIPRLRDYSRTGPLRGHSHLTFCAPNFYVAHPRPFASVASKSSKGSNQKGLCKAQLTGCFSSELALACNLEVA